MDSLLCDEVWLSTPLKTPDTYRKSDRFGGGDGDSVYSTCNGDCDEGIVMFLDKELSYMPKSGYIDRLHSQNLLLLRFRAIQWLFKSCNRLNLSCSTVFNAANYLDRFISINECDEWHHWMVELLSVSCLSVASKFNETDVPSLDEIQMEGLNHSFQLVTIQKMELILLQTLGWLLGNTTSYSYVELLTINTNSFKRDLQKDLSARVSKLLVGAMLDHKMVEYRPSTVAISALWCGLDELAPSRSDSHITIITSRLNQDDKDNVAQCHRIMQVNMFNPLYNSVTCGLNYYNPSSPVSVLSSERVDIYDHCVDLSLFKKLESNRNGDEGNKNKRKREEK